MTSGAVKGSVPAALRQRQSVPTARPKSRSLISRSGPQTPMFSGLMSRWATPRPWQCSMALASCRCTLRAPSSLSGPCACKTRNMFRFPATSMRMKRCDGPSTAPKTWAMFSCESLLWKCSSKRAAFAAEPFACTALRASSWPVSVFVAKKTLPNFPVPKQPSRRQGPTSPPLLSDSLLTRCTQSAGAAAEAAGESSSSVVTSRCPGTARRVKPPGA
mmetsp:Transcript_8026/g.20356  ORF Transcript_8026/g.20356 Transcript_8026/m.20356 type:complete len:217 (-) Transcript_8026:560-1210(-)